MVVRLFLLPLNKYFSMTTFEKIDLMEKFRETLTLQQIAYYKQNPTEEVWVNDKYIVHKRIDLPMGNNSGALLTHLSVRNTDNTPIRDWREMQYIKNELVGEDKEGFELFPKENRLVDTANQFHIWVFQDSENGIPIGFSERCVTDLCEHPQHRHKLKVKGKQRPFDSDRKPHDNYKNFKTLVEQQNKLK